MLPLAEPLVLLANISACPAVGLALAVTTKVLLVLAPLFSLSTPEAMALELFVKL